MFFLHIIDIRKEEKSAKTLRKKFLKNFLIFFKKCVKNACLSFLDVV